LNSERKLISEETLSFKTREAQETVFDGNSPENVKEVKLEPLFKLQILETATDNFDISKKLGQGGFGAVYRVILLELKVLYNYFEQIGIYWFDVTL
jgi:hypothetical protein